MIYESKHKQNGCQPKYYFMNILTNYYTKMAKQNA